MRINQYFCVFAASLFLAGTNSLFAVTLQGACTGCFTIGSNVVTTTNPLTVFDFAESSGPSLSGDLLLDILVPNNEDSSPSSMSFTITGTPNGTHPRGVAHRPRHRPRSRDETHAKVSAIFLGRHRIMR